MERLVYERELAEITAALTDSERDKFMGIFLQDAQNPVALYGWNIWLGWLGVDRFIVGDILLGVLKLITLGGLGIWQIVDCFLIGNRTRRNNIEKARHIFEAIKERRPVEI